MIILNKYFTSDKDIYIDSLKLRNRLLRMPIGKNIFDENLDIEKNNTFYGAFDDGCLIGTLSFFEEIINVAHLTAFAIDTDYQRIGIGSLLIEMLVSDLKEKKFTKINVDARESAKIFYEKCGFEVIRGPVLNKKLLVKDFEMTYSLI